MGPSPTQNGGPSRGQGQGGGGGGQRQKRISVRHCFVVAPGWGLGAGVVGGRGKNEVAADTTSFCPGQRQAGVGVGLGAGQRQRRISPTLIRFCRGGKVPWPFWFKVHAVPRQQHG